MAKGITRKTKSLQSRIVSGSVVLLTGSGLTMAITLAYNIVVARFLGPQGFGYATVVYTIITLLSAVMLSFQIIAAKMVAQQSSRQDESAVYRSFHHGSWICGATVGLFLAACAKPVGSYLNLPNADLVAIIALGAAFYVPLGARRGFIQGTCAFRKLAVNMVLEQAVRLAGSLVLVLLGAGVAGVIAANSAAIAIAYFAIRPPLAGRTRSPLQLSYAARETFQATIFFAGQMVITNYSIVLVNHFFVAHVAGLYAAVAIVGRVVFSFSQAVVNSTFPLVAATGEEQRRDLRVIATSLMLVLGTGIALSVGLCIAPDALWTHLFGPGFAIAGKYGISYLLALYALANVIYSLGAVIITFEMSYKIANTSWVQLAFSGVVIAAICRYHSSLREVVLVQLVLMSVLFVLVALPFLITSLTASKSGLQGAVCSPVRVLRRVSEDQVIAEFLKSDFHRREFREYHESLGDLVIDPNLDDPDANAKRRALLFIRHLSLWKELPVDTEWYEVELNESDLQSIRIFPRAHWRRVADGNFSATEVAEGVRVRSHLLEATFIAKIEAINKELQNEQNGFGAVLLIGVSENEPLTVLDGNHRLIAAMLSSPARMKKLRFFCGLSPRMTECCWYNSNLMTLFRYGRNVLTHTVRNPEAKLARVLRNP